MMDVSTLSLFIVTFFFVSLTPGMCMTLSMTLAMRLGLKRTLNMMVGELFGVATVVILAAIGVASIMLSMPTVFIVFKYLGGAYLFYLGIQMWRNKGKMAIDQNQDQDRDRPMDMSARQLALQGFVTAIANPKGWAFVVSLLPPFIDSNKNLLPQLSMLLGIILILEFICLMLYACGGHALRHFLQKANNVRLMNRIAGSLMMAVGIWLGTTEVSDAGSKPSAATSPAP